MPLPQDARRQAFLLQAQGSAFSYPASGRTRDAIPCPPVGYDWDESVAIVGRGRADFQLARSALQRWRMLPASWVRVLPPGAEIVKGADVALLIRVLGRWWWNACRIVYVVDEPRRWGFAYGTLETHAERGEELFLLELGEDELLRFTIRAFSRPRHPLARLAYPFARWLQRRFRSQAAAALRRAIIPAVD